MSWFLRGVQSAVFHYASCAPCTGYTDGRKRRRAANKARKLRQKLQLEHPDDYHHPEPTGTNPFWDEEIQMGPGPPPRRARRTNTGNSRAIATAETNSTILSKGESSSDTDVQRLSDDTVDDDKWNRKRYQREDENLWGIDEPGLPIRPIASASSSVGGSGFSLKRPGTSRSGSYYSVRAPPVNDLHPPVVSLPSPDPADSRWMLQPPPKASVMAGKERATTRSRSGSGASSKVELSLQRQLSARHVMHRLDRGETPEIPSISPNSSYSNLVAGQRHDRSRTPQARPPSASSSRRRNRREKTIARTDTSSTHASEHSPALMEKSNSSPGSRHVPDISAVRVRPSRPALSTVVSSGSGERENLRSKSSSRTQDNDLNSSFTFPQKPSKVHYRNTTYSSTGSTGSTPYLLTQRAPLSSSDISSLNALQELVSPRDLLKSRWVSAPLVEAKIRLPPGDGKEVQELSKKTSFVGSGFKIRRDVWDDKDDDRWGTQAPFDSQANEARDPRLRWSVDF